MGKIHVLSEDLINKIAAGEVIERPASVVKELVENSLDAGATSIIVRVDNYGKNLIMVCDNGEGMEEEDAQLSVLRHATSKLKKQEDLFSIKTLGFRGEALASIAAVSKFSLLTKQKWMVGGYELNVEGGMLIGSQVTSAEVGTTIIVRDLFFNTPVRRKFLKSDAVELKHIVEIVNRYALIHPEIAFKLIHNDQELMVAPVVDDLRDNIASIYSVTVAKDLLEVKYDDELIKIRGYIGKPFQARNDKNMQVLFVNKRWIKNEDIAHAVYEGYHAMLFVNKHPIFFLDLMLDAEKIDVNVHPQKSEIRIEQKEYVAQAILNAVRATLQQHNLIPAVEVNFEEQLAFSGNRPFAFSNKSKYAFEQSQQTVLKVQEKEEEWGTSEGGLVQEKKVVVKEQKEESAAPSASSKIPAFRLLGNIHKTFFVAETDGGAFFIDQHAAHERVMYERLMKEFMIKEIAVQRLLQPEIMELSSSEKVVFDENREIMCHLGFEMEPFHGNTVVIKSVPLVLGRLQVKELVQTILGLGEKRKLSEIQEEIITRMACRAAVMAGDIVTIVQMEGILHDLGQTEHPFTCPHGRPTIIKTSFEELEKKFKRK
jgi:DNA mismatch repair protein MutL